MRRDLAKNTLFFKKKKKLVNDSLYVVSTTNWPLPSTFTMIKLQVHIMKGVHGGNQEWGTLALEKMAKQGNS